MLTLMPRSFSPQEGISVRTAVHMTKPAFSLMRKQCLPSPGGVGNLAPSGDSFLDLRLTDQFVAMYDDAMERL